MNLNSKAERFSAILVEAGIEARVTFLRESYFVVCPDEAADLDDLACAFGSKARLDDIEDVPGFAPLAYFHA